jgi:hypothetical protein
VARRRRDPVEVGGQEISRRGAIAAVHRRRDGDRRRRRAGQERIALGILERLALIDHRDRDRGARARLHARRCLADGEPVAAHVALADDAAARAVLRDLVGTGERAVLAADALIVEVLDDAGHRMFLVGADRAARQTRGREAVVACGAHRLLERRRRAAAVQHADRAPGLAVVEPVEVVARRHARLAACAAIEIDLEGVLLAVAGWARGQPCAIARPGELADRRAGEAVDRGQLVLRAQVVVEQRQPHRQPASAWAAGSSTQTSPSSIRIGNTATGGASFDRHAPDTRSNVFLCSGQATFGVP